MFTASFYKFYPDGSQLRDVVSCTGFQVYEESSGVKLVTLRPDVHFKGGVEFKVSANEEDYSSCEIKDSNGRSVEFVRGFEQN